MKRWLICYDIEDDRERRRVHNCLRHYGKRVQKSVFEVCFPERKLAQQARMVEELREIAGEDANIRFYNLTKKGLERSWTLNDDSIMERPGAIIL